jgi:hypothetical protein
MPRHSPIPDFPLVTKLFRGLLGRAVTVTASVDAQPISINNKNTYTSLYLADKYVVTVVVCDLPLAAASGAALALIPAPRVEEWVREGHLPDDAVENVREVFNVMASTFNESNPGVHLKLGFFFPSGHSIPGAAAGFYERNVRRMDYKVQVEGYGSGLFTVLVL